MLESIQNILSLITTFEKIHFYCVDPGAFAVLNPVYEAKKNDRVDIRWILDGWCRNNKKEISFIELSTFENSYRCKLNKDVCLVLGSQTSFKSTQDVIGYCRENGIYSIFLFDHWGNYLSHFYDYEKSKLYLPNKICVIDDVSKKSLVSVLTPLLEDKNYINNIVVVGHPGVEKSVADIHNISKKEKVSIRNKIGAGNKKVILFLSEPIEKDLDGKSGLGYTEYSILTYFFNNFALYNAKVLIKPHPRQDIKALRSFLANEINHMEIDYELAEGLSLEEFIAVSDEVFGITTMALVIALKAGKKIKSIQVGRNENANKTLDKIFAGNLVI
ncbi:MAG TPA: hypothetical protein ENH82_02675 [bacterium]|nr:hypothetical protein [bacterium]